MQQENFGQQELQSDGQGFFQRFWQSPNQKRKRLIQQRHDANIAKKKRKSQQQAQKRKRQIQEENIKLQQLKQQQRLDQEKQRINKQIQDHKQKRKQEDQRKKKEAQDKKKADEQAERKKKKQQQDQRERKQRQDNDRKQRERLQKQNDKYYADLQKNSSLYRTYKTTKDTLYDVGSKAFGVLGDATGAIKDVIGNTAYMAYQGAKGYGSGMKMQTEGVAQTALGMNRLANFEPGGLIDVASGYMNQLGGAAKTEAGKNLLTNTLMPLGALATGIGGAYKVYRSIKNSDKLKKLKELQPSQRAGYVAQMIGQGAQKYYDQNVKPITERNSRIINNAVSLAGNAVKGLAVGGVNTFIPSAVVTTGQKILRQVLVDKQGKRPQIFLNVEDKPLGFSDFVNLNHGKIQSPVNIPNQPNIIQVRDSGLIGNAPQNIQSINVRGIQPAIQPINQNPNEQNNIIVVAQSQRNIERNRNLNRRRLIKKRR